MPPRRRRLCLRCSLHGHYLSAPVTLPRRSLCASKIIMASAAHGSAPAAPSGRVQPHGPAVHGHWVRGPGARAAAAHSHTHTHTRTHTHTHTHTQLHTHTHTRVAIATPLNSKTPRLPNHPNRPTNRSPPLSARCGRQPPAGPVRPDADLGADVIQRPALRRHSVF